MWNFKHANWRICFQWISRPSFIPVNRIFSNIYYIYTIGARMLTNCCLFNKIGWKPIMSSPDKHRISDLPILHIHVYAYSIHTRQAHTYRTTFCLIFPESIPLNLIFFLSTFVTLTLSERNWRDEHTLKNFSFLSRLLSFLFVSACPPFQTGRVC